MKILELGEANRATGAPVINQGSQGNVIHRMSVQPDEFQVDGSWKC